MSGRVLKTIGEVGRPVLRRIATPRELADFDAAERGEAADAQGRAHGVALLAPVRREALRRTREAARPFNAQLADLEARWRAKELRDEFYVRERDALVAQRREAVGAAVGALRGQLFAAQHKAAAQAVATDPPVSVEEHAQLQTFFAQLPLLTPSEAVPMLEAAVAGWGASDKTGLLRALLPVLRSLASKPAYAVVPERGDPTPRDADAEVPTPGADLLSLIGRTEQRLRGPAQVAADAVQAAVGKLDYGLDVLQEVVGEHGDWTGDERAHFRDANDASDAPHGSYLAMLGFAADETSAT